GQSVTFTFTVTNNSAEAATITALSDTDFTITGDVDCQVGTLLGAGASCNFTHTTPISGDFGGPDHVNTASVTVADDDGNSDFDTDDETVTFEDMLPTVTITKTVDDNSVPETGQNVTFTFTVTNTSSESVTVTALGDTDFSFSGTSCDPGTVLAAGGSCTFNFVLFLSGTPGVDHQNTANVSVEDDDGNTASDTDTATVTFENVVAPALNIVKEVSDDNATWVNNVTVSAGDPVYFRVRVANTGDLTLTGLTVDDGMAGCTLARGGDLLGDNDTDFEAGEEWVYYCNLSAAAGTHPNTATASSNETPQDSDGAQYSAQADPSALTKSLAATNQSFTSGSNVAIGEILTYQVELTIPPGTFSSAQLVDTMGHGLAFVSCESITSSGPALTTSIGTFADVCAGPVVGNVDGGAENDGRQVTYNFGALTNTSGADQTLTIRYRAVVLDIEDNQAGITLQISADFTSSAPTNLNP
ncbi:MAG: isopeptide-forming domain-containing fimbrial protein, partial [Gammaproteobacteria bacterium]